MGTIDLDVHLDFVRGVERRVIWISWERHGPVRGPYGVSLSHWYWNWVSLAVWAPRDNLEAP